MEKYIRDKEKYEHYLYMCVCVCVYQKNDFRYI